MRRGSVFARSIVCGDCLGIKRERALRWPARSPVMAFNGLALTSCAGPLSCRQRQQAFYTRRSPIWDSWESLRLSSRTGDRDEVEGPRSARSVCPAPERQAASPRAWARRVWARSAGASATTWIGPLRCSGIAQAMLSDPPRDVQTAPIAHRDGGPADRA